MQYSVVQTSKLDEIAFRLDAEFYHPDYITLQTKLSTFDSLSLRELGGTLDCSAFYPSIVPYYNFEKVGIPFLRVNEIQNGLLHISSDTVFLPKKILDENRTTIACCCPGDLIIAKGGNSLAKVAFLTEEYPPEIGKNPFFSQLKLCMCRKVPSNGLLRVTSYMKSQLNVKSSN